MKKNISPKKKYLNYKEKFELMTEFMKETGEKIKHTTTYKGYNIGIMKANLRTLYYNGTLKMDEQLLNKFISSGILSVEKEKNRHSQQEKYEFLMLTVGKSKEEISNLEAKLGLTFQYVKNQFQTDYNKGTLKLSSHQIDNLRKSGFLNYSTKEKNEFSEQFGLPSKYIVDIIKKYGSYDNFIKQYKTGQINYNFHDDIFCGYRGITIFEKEITEEQKLEYAKLNHQVNHSYDNFKNGDYIDLNILDSYIKLLDERPRKIIEMYYGLDGKKFSSKQICEYFNISRNYVNEIRHKAILKLTYYNINFGKSSKNINSANISDIDILRYNAAKDNYLDLEDIFAPKGIVPAVQIDKTKIEQTKKDELKKSIKHNQQELAKSLEILKKLEQDKNENSHEL